MIGIVVTIHNRAALTRQSLEDLRSTQLPPDEKVMVILVDDCSTDAEAIGVVDAFTMDFIPVLKIRHAHAAGIRGALLHGIEVAIQYGCNIITNLDNDVRLKTDWLVRLLELHRRCPTRISTAFHSTTRNRDGSDRHQITKQYDGYCHKNSVGGINMMFGVDVYEKIIKNVLQQTLGNWDQQACLCAGGAMCLTPSAIQHTGVDFSSLGHNEPPDTAEGFEQLHLPDVTLIGVNCGTFHTLEAAANVSTRDIKFGAVKLLTSDATNNPNAIHIPPINSKEAYNNFVISKLYAYVDTQFALIIQDDGYVLNYKAWRNEWLQYDYIGATWLYKDGMNVGNGGFCLRTRRLMYHVAQLDPGVKMPEDHVICRTLRPHLVKEGFIFAPEEEANRFSIEAYGSDKLPGGNRYSGQFGFHGYGVDYTGSALTHIPKRNKFRR